MSEDRRLRRLKLRDLHVLEVVAEAGSMAKAAPLLAMSQPAVSRIVAEMEHTVGVPLFDRSPAGVELTSFGEVLRKRAVNAVDELKQGLGEISFLTNPTEGEIRIGCTEPMTTLASAILQRMSSRYPRFVFHVTAADTRVLHQLLRDREIELAISRIASPHTDEDIQSEPLFEDELVVLAGKQHPLARRKKLSLRDLMEERWIFGPEQHSFLRSFIEEAFADAGLRMPPATVESASSYLRNSLLAAGPFLTILPGALLRYPRPHPTLTALAVRLPTTRRPVGLLWLRHRTMSPIAQIFCATAREAAKPMRSNATSR
jgi:DNA-binding transcriptional LysR family regulator